MWMLHNLRECFNTADEWHAFIVGVSLCSPNRFFTDVNFEDLRYKKWYYYFGRLTFFVWAGIWISCLAFVLTCVASGV